MTDLYKAKFQPTMRLRFSKRKSKNFPSEDGHKYILQQQWRSRDGEVKWVDVPRFDPYVGKYCEQNT